MVFTPTLTGLGERSHLMRPDLTMEDFATDVARGQSGWEYLEFASGHDAMVISPDALTELLVRCASGKSRS
jgi:hypothetical protein